MCGGGENVADVGEFSASLSCFFFHMCFPKTHGLGNKLIIKNQAWGKGIGEKKE